jgi:hypothetical protein
MPKNLPSLKPSVVPIDMGGIVFIATDFPTQLSIAHVF